MLKLSRMLEGETCTYFEYQITDIKSLTLVCDKHDLSVRSVICLREPVNDIREIVVDHDLKRLMYIENVADENYNLFIDELIRLVKDEEC